MPSCSRARSRSESVRGEIPRHECSSSVKRRGPSEEAEREARLSPADATAQMRINVPAQRNRKLRTLLGRVNEDEAIKAYWHVSNVNAVKRLGINDHSSVHTQIVANIALRLLRLLAKRGVEPAMVADYGLESDDAEVVVVLGALLHCIGMAVHRDRHEDWSLFLSDPKARELLQGIYKVDELLKAKMHGSGLEPYVEVVARIDTEAEKSLVPIYSPE